MVLYHCTVKQYHSKRYQYQIRYCTVWIFYGKATLAANVVTKKDADDEIRHWQGLRMYPYL